jgi:hypothetical protein
MQTARGYYGPGNGVIDVNFEWDAMHVDSAIFASVSEAHAEGVLEGGRDARRFLGAAGMTVLNVVPHDSGCNVRVHIDWGEPLFYAVDFLVFD